MEDVKLQFAVSPTFISETCQTHNVLWFFLFSFTFFRKGSSLTSEHDSSLGVHYQRASDADRKGIKLQCGILSLSLAWKRYLNKMERIDKDRWELSVTTAFRDWLSQNNLMQAILWSITPSRIAYSIIYKTWRPYIIFPSSPFFFFFFSSIKYVAD